MVTLSALILGILLVFIGVICVYTVNLTVGTITAISGSLVDIFGTIAFKFNKEANDRLERTIRELSILDRTAVAMHCITHISDQEKKDQAIIDLTKQLYALSSHQEGIEKSQGSCLSESRIVQRDERMSVNPA